MRLISSAPHTTGVFIDFSFKTFIVSECDISGGKIRINFNNKLFINC